MEPTKKLKPNTPELVVKANNISKVFGKHIWAIKNVSLEIYKNECISLLGSNGGGKTTLIRLLANNLKPTLGEVTYFLNESDLIRAIGFQKKEQEWPSGFTVKDVTAIWINAYDIKDLDWINYIKDVFGINQIWDKYLSKQSLVKKQLFALFLAFLYKPELVLIDELSSDIDWKYSEKISLFLREYMKKGNTIVLNSPSPYFLERLTTRVIYIHNGEIIDDISKRKIKSEYKTMMNYSKTIFKEEVIKEKTIFNKRRIFAPIINKINTYSKILEEEINKNRTNKENNQTEMEEIINVIFYMSALKSSITDFYKQDIDVHTIKIAIKAIKNVGHELRKIRKYLKNEQSELSKFTVEFLKRIITYIEEDLISLFSNEKNLYGQSEVQNILSIKEKKELNKLKRKYLKEEFKHLQNRARVENIKKTFHFKKPEDKVEAEEKYYEQT